MASLSLVPAVATEKAGEQGASAARLPEDVAGARVVAPRAGSRWAPGWRSRRRRPCSRSPPGAPPRTAASWRGACRAVVALACAMAVWGLAGWHPHGRCGHGGACSRVPPVLCAAACELLGAPRAAALPVRAHHLPQLPDSTSSLSDRDPPRSNRAPPPSKSRQEEVREGEDEDGARMCW